MYPFERDLYVDLLKAEIEKINNKDKPQLPQF